MIILLARDRGKKAAGGISAFLITHDLPGFCRGKNRGKKWGQCASGHYGPAVHQLPGAGIAHAGPGRRRICHCHVRPGTPAGSALHRFSLGIAQAALDESIKYSKQRLQFQNKISDFSGHPLDDRGHGPWMWEAARLLVLNAAAIKERGENCTARSLHGQVLCLGNGPSGSTGQAIQIHGGYGYIKEYPVERFLPGTPGSRPFMKAPTRSSGL